MNIGSADVAEAINTAWDESVLDATFQALWGIDVVSAEFLVLHDTETEGEQPFPYCVFEVESSAVTDRMSEGENTIREIRNFPITFKVYAKEIESDPRTAKEVASYLAEAVTKVFGGHPILAPTATLVLSNGNHLGTTLDNSQGIKEDQDHYQWLLSYQMMMDVPVTLN